MQKSVIEVLQARGFIDQITGEELKEIVMRPIKIYIGFDPTSDSLHLGNWLGIMALRWFKKFGHTPIALIGGATGMIGDPSGKSHERNLLDEKTIAHNLEGIRRSLGVDVEIVNNMDWIGKFTLIDFLRDVGKYFRVGTMLGKESVRLRLASEEGISYTEFSYQLIQGYDFLHLYKTSKVVLQMGGSDQWGNITAGIELIRKTCGGQAYGATWPLLTRSDGKKFGKSEEGTIWLNPDKLSPYDFYQYLYRMPDQDVVKMMKLLTMMELEEIDTLANSNLPPRTLQKRLAEEMTLLVHGEEGLQLAQRVTEQAQPGYKTTLDEKTLETLFAELPHVECTITEVVGQKLIDLLASLQVLQSKGEARRMLAGGGLYLNNEKIEDVEKVIEEKDLVAKRYLLFGIGKKKKVILRVR